MIKRDNLKRSIISKLKITKSTKWFVFKNGQNFLEDHPLLKDECDKRKINLSFIEKSTVHININEEIKESYIECNNLIHRTRVQLLSLSDSKRKDDTFAKQVRKLKSSPDTDSAQFFLASLKKS